MFAESRPRKKLQACSRSGASSEPLVKIACTGTFSARAIWRKTSTEALPEPLSSCARKRSETPDFSARALRVRRRLARAARTFFPSSSRYSASLRRSVALRVAGEDAPIPFWEVVAISGSCSKAYEYLAQRNLLLLRKPGDRLKHIPAGRRSNDFHVLERILILYLDQLCVTKLIQQRVHAFDIEAAGLMQFR